MPDLGTPFIRLAAEPSIGSLGCRRLPKPQGAKLRADKRSIVQHWWPPKDVLISDHKIPPSLSLLTYLPLYLANIGALFKLVG